MGVSCMNTCSGTTPSSPIGVFPNAMINPDPLRFEVIDVQKKGNYILAVVQYLGVTNYEGRKILLIATEMTIRQFNNMRYLDPHFSEQVMRDKKTGLPYIILARFEPSEVGKLIALKTFKDVSKYSV